MAVSLIDGVIVTPLKIFTLEKGDVFHGIKASDNGYFGFGEAYFSTVKRDEIKGWKKHKEMVLNLIVPIGSVRFILYDDRKNQINQFQEIVLSFTGEYARLTVPPMVWVAFQGLDHQSSLVLNIASIEHSPEEIERKELDEIKFNWSKS